MQHRALIEAGGECVGDRPPGTREEDVPLLQARDPAEQEAGLLALTEVLDMGADLFEEGSRDPDLEVPHRGGCRAGLSPAPQPGEEPHQVRSTTKRSIHIWTARTGSSPLQAKAKLKPRQASPRASVW